MPVTIAAIRRRLLFLVALLVSGLVAAADLPAVFPQLRGMFPDADAYGGFELNPPSAAVYKGGQTVGYVFLTDDALRIPAYSGKPINTLIGLDTDGRIVGLAIVHHDEPILAVGIQPERLARHVAQYVGLSAFDLVTIGAKREGYVALDGIAGATITVMVENSTVMRAARMVAESRGIRNPGLLRSSRAAAPVPAAETSGAAPLRESTAVPPAPAGTPVMPSAPTAGAAAPTAVATTPTAKAAPRVAASSSVAPKQAANAPDARATRPAAPPRESAASMLRPPPRSLAAVVPLAPDMPPPNVAPLPAHPGTWTPPEETPEWVAIWKNRSFEIGALLAGLAVLFFILIFQDWLARHPTALTYVRNGFHVYTLFFLGWWSMAQLSVINVLTFVNSAMHGFRWENFLIDPLLFILWSFVAVTLLLWGRGVYCGWLCPFGALQELILLAARRLKLPEWEFPDVVHERLWAVKYILLIVIFGLSLQSLTDAAGAAEVEPFKTVFALRFDREASYVLYALALIAIAFVNRKFYCKYLCTLGAAIAVPGRFRLFDWWLRRRKECGKPCQVCAHRCSVRAIRPTGEINANECHYCLDCQVIYYNENVCLPLIDRRKRRDHRTAEPAAESGT